MTADSSRHLRSSTSDKNSTSPQAQPSAAYLFPYRSEILPELPMERIYPNTAENVITEEETSTCPTKRLECEHRFN